jgi:hypothetical protein
MTFPLEDLSLARRLLLSVGLWALDSGSRPRLGACWSSTSSNVVAEVEYEPWAEEERLWGGEGRLSMPSEPRAPASIGTATEVPLPLRRLAPPDGRE